MSKDLLDGLYVMTMGGIDYLQVTPQLVQLLEDAKKCIGIVSQRPEFTTYYDQPYFNLQYQKVRQILKELA